MNSLTRQAVSLSLIGLTCSFPVPVMATIDAPASAKISKATQQKATLLFVLRADTGSIAKTDVGYTLTLKGMDDKVLYFSDRPVRKAGFITMTQFMSDWAKGKDSFQANPPNAAIIHAALKTNEKGIAQAIPVELKNPVESSDGWVFRLTDLQGKIRIGDYNSVTVFVDSWCSNCIRFYQGQEAGTE